VFVLRPCVRARARHILQLIESYRIIIDTTTALSNDPPPGQGRPPTLEALQRISQSAALGLRLLGSNVSTEPPGAVLSPGENPGTNPWGAEEGDAAAKRQACLHSSPPWGLVAYSPCLLGLES